MAFDPAKYGAEKIEDTKKSSFDPSKYGAEPIQEAAPAVQTPVTAQQPVENESFDINNSLDVGVKSIGRGVKDLGLDMADVAASILEHYKLTKPVGKGAKTLIEKGRVANVQTPEELQHPIASSIGRGVGY